MRRRQRGYPHCGNVAAICDKLKVKPSKGRSLLKEFQSSMLQSQSSPSNFLFADGCITRLSTGRMAQAHSAEKPRIAQVLNADCCLTVKEIAEKAQVQSPAQVSRLLKQMGWEKKICAIVPKARNTTQMLIERRKSAEGLPFFFTFVGAWLALQICASLRIQTCFF